MEGGGRSPGFPTRGRTFGCGFLRTRGSTGGLFFVVRGLVVGPFKLTLLELAGEALLWPLGIGADVDGL